MTNESREAAAPNAIAAKGRKVLNFAEEFAKTAEFQADLRNALYNSHGVMALVFANSEERRAFRKTKEYRKLLALIEGLPAGPMLDEEYEIRIPAPRAKKRTKVKSA